MVKCFVTVFQLTEELPNAVFIYCNLTFYCSDLFKPFLKNAFDCIQLIYKSIVSLSLEMDLFNIVLRNCDDFKGVND